MMKRSILAVLAVAVLVGLAALQPAAAQNEPHATVYKVRVTNLTRSQVLSPPIVVSHHRNFALFHLGQPASPELAQVAEDAINDPLVDLLQGEPLVMDVGVGAAPIPPGQSELVEVQAGFPFDHVSVVGMLVTTNDAFYAIDGVVIPFRRMHDVHYANAYDAGTETNNESCAFIPGPPCGNVGVRDTANAEGRIFVHAGIHGGGDLDPAIWDWRNPVAEISIQRKE